MHSVKRRRKWFTALLQAPCYDHEFNLALRIVYDDGCVHIRQRHHVSAPFGALKIDVFHLHSFVDRPETVRDMCIKYVDENSPRACLCI